MKKIFVGLAMMAAVFGASMASAPAANAGITWNSSGLCISIPELNIHFCL